MNYNKNVYICVIYTISITLINYLRILLYDIVIDSLRQRTFILACSLVFKYMLIHFNWPPLSRIHGSDVQPYTRNRGSESHDPTTSNTGGGAQNICGPPQF